MYEQLMHVQLAHVHVQPLSYLLQPERPSPGLAESRSEAVDTLTVSYPTVQICTTSVSHSTLDLYLP